MTELAASAPVPAASAPDLLDIVYWLQHLADPVERMKLATLYADRARDELLPELASVRRLATVQARTALMEQGHTATEATRILAQQVGMSTQTVARMISERKQYGG